MKKIYELHNVWSSEDVSYLQQFGIKREPLDSDPIQIEDGNLYSILHNYFSDVNKHMYYSEYYGYEYSIDEIISSEYCILKPLGGRGYPEPTDNFGYLDIVYDSNCLCRKCGQEKKQVGEFRVSKVPRRAMFGFSAWEYDTIFMTEGLYRSIFAPLGVGFRLLNKPSGKPLEGYLQLDIPISEEPLDLRMYEYEICPICGKKKYSPKFDYPYFPIQDHPLPHIYLSKEYFGYGGEASRRFFVSTGLALQLLEKKVIKIGDLIPCRR